jgi:hypothetical protein
MALFIIRVDRLITIDHRWLTLAQTSFLNSRSKRKEIFPYLLIRSLALIVILRGYREL